MSNVKEKGFTLVEAMAAVLLLVIVGFVAYHIYGTAQTKHNASTATPQQKTNNSTKQAAADTQDGSYTGSGYTVTPLKFSTTISRAKSNKDWCETDKICSVKSVLVTYSVANTMNAVKVINNDAAKGVGLMGTGYSINADAPVKIYAYVDASKPNGTYSGTTTLGLDNKTTGPTISYTITVTD